MMNSSSPHPQVRLRGQLNSRDQPRPGQSTQEQHPIDEAHWNIGSGLFSWAISGRPWPTSLLAMIMYLLGLSLGIHLSKYY
ncbi:hypothetical protein BDV12DRAFT_178521 [Aspergillus spectabilis]